MENITITRKGYQCDKCGHKWVQRLKQGPKPRICPVCKRPDWNSKSGENSGEDERK